jgi:cytolysin (calcineurin-like family phosphatase)
MLFEFENPFVFWTSVKDHQKIKDKLVPRIKRDSANEDLIHRPNEFMVSSFYSQTYDYITDEMLKNIVWDPLEQMHVEKQIMTPSNYTLEAFWWNVYQPGGFAKVHSHASADWSGVYLVHLEEPNQTYFYSHFGHTPNTGYMNQQKILDEAVEGDVILFPSFLEHSFHPGAKDRIIIAFDIISNHGRPRVNIVKKRKQDLLWS